jgi:hypothetical protein
MLDRPRCIVVLVDVLVTFIISEDCLGGGTLSCGLELLPTLGMLAVGLAPVKGFKLVFTQRSRGE